MPNALLFLCDHLLGECNMVSTDKQLNLPHGLQSPQTSSCTTIPPHPDPDPHPFHDVPHLSTHAVLHLLSPGLRPSLRPAAQPTVPQPELSANAAHYHTLCCPPVLRWPAPPTTTSPTSPPILSNQLRLHLVPLRVKPSPPCP